MPDYSNAYGTAIISGNSMTLSSASESANVTSVDNFDSETGITEISFLDSNNNEFGNNPAVVATPIASSGKQIRIDSDTDGGIREQTCIVDTYDQDPDSSNGTKNDGLRNISYGFVATVT